MNTNVKFRLTVLGLAMAGLWVFIVFITLISQRQGAALHDKLDQVDAESYGLAEHFKDLLREGGDRLSHYRNSGEVAGWRDFTKSSQELAAWIDQEITQVSTADERRILQQMQVAFGDYQKVAGEVYQYVQAQGARENLPESLSDRLSLSRRHLIDMGQDLSQAHLTLKKQLLTEAHAMVGRIRWLVLGALTLLFLLGAGLALFVYRDMIAPLRNQLVAARSLAEQQEKMASLGLLAAGVAHEIRNPLTAVKAALFTQQKKFAPGSPEYQDVKVVEREISRLERIVTDFLKFARPADPEARVIAADLLLMDVRMFLAPQLTALNIQLVQEPSAPVHVQVDPEQLKQVLINLVQNAADSIGRDGTVTLRSRLSRRPLLNGQQSTVILEVADTGRGITAEAQKRIFDPFFTTKESGTGLGLSIAARIVQKNGGRLQFQSQVNRGTTFGILLPQATP